MITPSTSMCGLFCISSRSLNVPGSDSSALHTRYFCMSPLGRNEILRPVGKPAPPRPRMFESSSCWSTSSRDIDSALRSDW